MAGDVWLFTGCVMDAWMRPTHRATAAVLEAAGATVSWSPADAGVLRRAARPRRARSTRRAASPAATIAAMPGDAPVLVNSAGCGAAMKDYGHLLGTAEAEAFAARVRDVHEWLAERVDRLPPATGAAPRR